LTRRADSPVRDVGFINVIAVIVGRRETGCGANCAIDVDDAGALSTDEVVVIVVHAVFVAGRGTNGLDATQEVVVNENGESVVDRLTRDAADVGLGDVSYFVGGHVGPT
jgi:hypothetical protein